VTLRALIPVNRLERAKGRLETLLLPDERRELALATLRTVVAATRDAGLEPVVLTADAVVAREMAGLAQVVPEADGVAGLNAQLEGALTGWDEALVLHADLPLADGAAVSALVAAAGTPPSVTIVESGDGGTNAMLLRPPGRFALAYGPGSCARHRAAAEAAGAEVRLVALPALALDLDTPGDVSQFLASPGWQDTAAGELLAKIRVRDRRARLTPEGRRR
jgi:2-phospho-L-lactate guanylyltransferase